MNIFKLSYKIHIETFAEPKQAMLKYKNHRVLLPFLSFLGRARRASITLASTIEMLFDEQTFLMQLDVDFFEQGLSDIALSNVLR